jgi:pimeloyl-ACP methyl ester carboxylesterase
MRASIKAFGAVAVAVAASLGLFVSGADASAKPTLKWRPCTEAVEAGLQCATVQVPLDYSQPSGPQIGIAVVRHPATDPAARVGSLFWNPGGPGGAGTQTLAAVLPDFTAYERAHFDIVSFDPRGIGESDQLRCFSSFAEEQALLAKLPAAGFPSSPAQLQSEINTWAQFDQACAKNGGAIQFHMATADVARDMDRIRAALGDRQIYYDGTSYGTYLGVTYANLFPSRVARMVLDGNVDPVAWNDRQAGSQVSTFDRLNSPLGAELGLQTFLADCAAAGTSGCPFAAGNYAATLAKYRTLVQRLATQPVTVAGQPFTAAFLTTYVAGELESVQPAPALGLPGWAGIAQVLQALWTGSQPQSDHRLRAPALRRFVHPAGRALLAATGYPPEAEEGTYGVLCSESPNPADPESYVGQSALFNATESPDGFGSVWTWLAEPCAQWQARDADAYAGPWNRLPASKYLVIGTLADSNTAYVSSVKMAAVVGGARLLTETGGGHTSFLNQSTCVNDAIDAFYASGALPPPGTVCNQDKPPF